MTRRPDFNIQIKTRVVEQLYQHAPASITAVIINTLIVGFTFRNIIPLSVILPWVLTNTGVLLSRLILVRTTLRTSFSSENYRARYVLFGVSAFLSGSAFGSAGIILISPANPSYNVFIYFLLGGLFAGSMGSYAINKALFFMYSAPVFLPVLIHFLILGGELNTVMFFLGLIFLILMVTVMIRMNRSLISAIRLSLQNHYLLIKTRKLNHRLLKLSLHDTLTKLKNRRFVFDVLKDEIDRFAYAKAKLHSTHIDEDNLAGHVYGIFLIDIDHFKSVNDNYGHKAGDNVLIGFADTLRTLIRRNDAIIRWGGEEFLIILKRTEADYLKHFCSKVLSAVSSHSFSVKEDLCIQKTCSIGYASFPFCTDLPNLFTMEQTIEIADRALYHAKNTGRNRAIGVHLNVTDSAEHFTKLAQDGNLDALFGANLISFSQ